MKYLLIVIVFSACCVCKKHQPQFTIKGGYGSPSQPGELTFTIADTSEVGTMMKRILVNSKVLYYK